jgi:ribosomal-protein-alanine N-acetyltransferase
MTEARVFARQPRLSLGNGVVLRPWRSDDAPALVLAHRDAAVRHYAGYLIDDRPAAVEAILRWSHTWSDGSGAAWAVSGPGDQLLGAVRFGVVDTQLGIGSVGYWLDPQARGRGVATAALRVATAAVFTGLGWHRIELNHAVENERSCGVARRSGYRYEGVMRQAMRYPSDGRWSDSHLHARLAEDPDPAGHHGKNA